MQKDFDGWNKRKKDIHYNGESKLYHTREIWWCNLGVNIGSKQDGARKKLEKRLGRSVVSKNNFLKNSESKKRIGN